MKPTKLIISAFGPYPGLMPAIDFEKFDNQGFFLITGDTGAGKTTIFDAVCFALYGKTSGTYKDEDYLRCETADPGTESFVDLYFTHQGKNYRIYRKPYYTREKLRGSGITESVEKAVFYEEGGRSIEKLTDVNKKIHELLGLDLDQFRQVAVLAQGEFLKLLNTKTKDRTDILRTIFKTEGYSRMTDKLRERTNNCKQTVHDMELGILQSFGDIAMDPGDEHYEQLITLQQKARDSKSIWDIDELIGIADKAVESDKARSDSVTEELAKAEAELSKNKDLFSKGEDNNKVINRVKELEDARQKLDSKKQQMAEAEALLVRQKAASREAGPVYKAYTGKKEELSVAQKQHAEKEAYNEKAAREAAKAAESISLAQKKKPELESLNKLIDKLASDESKYSLKEENTSRLEKLNLSLAELSKEEQSILKTEEELVKRIESAEKVISDLKDRPVELQKAISEGKEIADLEASIDTVLYTMAEERDKRRAKLEEDQNAYIEAKRSYDEAHAEYLASESIYESNKAGILASKLEEGKACPVCGSTSHPRLACLTEDSITDEELKAIKDRETEFRNRKDDANARATSSNALFTEYEEQMRNAAFDALTECVSDVSPEGKTIDELLELLAGQKAVISDKKKENTEHQIMLGKECDLLNKTREELDTDKGAKSIEIKERREAISEQKRNNELAIKEAVTILDSLKDLEFEDWDKAKDELEAKKKAADEISKAIESATQAKAEADLDALEAKTRLDESVARVAAVSKEFNVSKAELDKKLAELGFSSEEELKPFIVKEEEIESAESELESYRQEVATNKTQLAQAIDDAKGKTLVDLVELKALCDSQEALVGEIRKKLSEITGRLNVNTAKRDSIVSGKKEYIAASDEYKSCERVYKLSNGMTGNGKITFEQYVQAAGFDGVIDAANKRLKKMSDQRYEIIRKETVSKKENTFLDLEVMDYDTGHRRPVGNISGGESFKAALSLALGLSDAIMSSKGGIQIDCMFIDEGFGTLDNSSIESAIETLDMLSVGNKLVGVISHREEVKSRVPSNRQIRVSKTTDGITINCDVE